MVYRPNAINIEVRGITKNLSGWAKELGIVAKSLNDYYHYYGEEHLIKRIEHYLDTGETTLCKKYSVGDKINGYKILEEVNDNLNRIHFKVKCLSCGFIYNRALDEIFRRPNVCPNHKISKSKNKQPLVKVKLLKIFSNIKRRCYDKNHIGYGRYGAKGVKICEKWLENSDNFVDWSLSNGYEEGLTIDRIDSSKDYCPENCRWITLGENSKRVCEATFLSIRRISDSYQGWSKRLNLSEGTVKSWVRKLGREHAIERIEDILDGNYKVKQPIKITVNNLIKSLEGWSKYFDLSKSYFFHYNEKYGLEAVKSKIEELLSKQGDYQK